MKKQALSANDYLNQAKWYIITVISGNENSVITNLKGKIASYGYSDKVEDIRIIKEKNITIEEFNSENAPASVGRKLKNGEWKTIEKNGKVYYQLIKNEERNKFSGYIFIKMFMDDDIWFIIRNTQLVTGIVGSSGKNAKPVPVSDEEIEMILNIENNQSNEIIENPEMNIAKDAVDIYKEEDAVVIETMTYTANFDINDQVKVIDGNMTGEIGVVISKNDSKGLALVEFEIFNRLSKIEIHYSNLEKI